MMNSQSAIEDIRKFASTLQNLVAFAGELEGVESLESYAKEIKARIADLEANEDTLKAVHSALVEKSNEISVQCESKLQDAEAAANALVVEAKSLAEAIEKEAVEKAAAVTFESEEMLSALREKVTEAQNELDVTSASVATTKQELEDLKAEISALKEKFK